MHYKYLDMENYKRKKHYEYFTSLAYPYAGVTVNVNITEFLKRVNNRKYPFFLSFCYCVANAANDVAEFRQRIKNGKIIEYEHCRTSHTVALEDGTYCYCVLDAGMPFEAYLPYAIEEQEKAKGMRCVEDSQDVNEMIFISTLPWLSYASLIQPAPVPADSNPRITWGKYFHQGTEVFMPVSLLCHHALADGLHMAQFYSSLDQYIK